MNRAKAILISLRLANSYLSTRLYTRARPLCSQVTLFPYHSLSLSNQSYGSHLVNTHQRLYFSSTPDSVGNLVLSNVWSTELESELEDLHPTWTHETVIFVLKKLYKDPKKAFDFFNWVCEKMGFRPSSSLYCIMLRILADQETMKQFWFTVKKMKDEGFYIDENTYWSISGQFKKAKMASDVAALFHFYKGMIQENAMDGVVESVVNVILGSVWNDSVEKQLVELNVVLSDNIVMRVLMKLRSRPSIASSFFHWVGHCQNYEHNTVTYNAIARILCQRDSIEEFWSVIEEMKGAGYEMDIDTYIKVSRQLQKNKMMEDSVRLYELMMDGPFKCSAQDCIMLLQSISRSEKPDLDLAFRVVKKFESAGHTLSKAVYDGIHRSLTGAGRFDEAEKIVNVMKNAGYEPDNITYSQLVFGLCKAKRLDEACRVVDEMEAHGSVPDIKTWTILIQGHCAAGEVDKALMCFANMMGKNCDADADLLDVLVNGFISQGKIEGAYNLLIEMVNRARLRPWQATIKVLIEKLLRVTKLEEALDLLRLMKKQNYPPYAEPFVQYISKFGTVEDAADFLKALTVKEYPSSSAYVHVLKSFFQEGRYSEAKDLLYKCPHHVRKHDEICKLFGSKDSTADPA